MEIKNQISEYNKKISFDSINPNSNELSTLVINEENGKICYSQDDIKFNFNSILFKINK